MNTICNDKFGGSVKEMEGVLEKLINEENDREPRTEEAEVVNEEVNCVSREEVKNTPRRIKKR